MAYPQRQTRSRGNSHTPVPGVPMMQQAYKPQMQYQYGGTPTRAPQAHAHAPPRPGGPAYPPPGGQAPPRPQVYQHPLQYPDGPLGFFLPPPGQRTLDASLQTAPTTQGFFTTYPARLRTGATSLLQPESVEGGPRERERWSRAYDADEANRSSGANTPRTESPAPRAGRTVTTTLSGRRAGRVNYAEKESSDEEDESDDEPDDAGSDPDDDTYGERRRRRDDAAHAQRVVRTKRRAEQAKSWTWLGDRVPAERVTTAMAPRARLEPQPEERLAAEAGRAEALVPISIDYDIPDPNGEGKGWKIKDRFLWNASEPFLKPLEFAAIFCADLGIHEQHAATIAELITAQVEEAQNAVAIDLQTRDVLPADVVFSDDEEEQPPAGGGEEEGAARYPEPDCRIVVNLDVQIFTHVLRDRIEWDLASPLPPAEFARHYCAELGLTGEAVPLVAHAIHEELLKHKRDALELELFARTHPLEQAKWERTAGGGARPGARGARRLVGVWREWFEREEFAPVLIELTHEDMEKREAERSRETRRMMRTLNTNKRRRY